MKLSTVTASDIKQAAKVLDDQGIPKDMVWNNYYVLVDGKEYPFKYLSRIAFELSKDDADNFESNESYRHYIETLGFKINHYKEGINFFTKEELEFYSAIANKKYEAANHEQKAYSLKLYTIIAKVNKWAELLKLPEFSVKKETNWINGHISKIKPYFWPRIYKGIDQDIFFNVEVNGAEQFLGIKLDVYYETQKKLPAYKIKIFEEYKEVHDLEFKKIPFSSLSEYNWDKLLEETSAFVFKYLADHDLLKEILTRDTRIARITWNSLNWVKPSGRVGKSNSQSFEKEKGYGHEEWLFASDAVIEGYKYGFLEPVHKFRSTYEGKSFDILLYTRNAETNESFWVTKLEDVKVISSEESEKILEVYKERGWYEQMRMDLFNLNLDTIHLDSWTNSKADELFNVKFTAEQLHRIPPDLIPFKDFSLPSDRYNLIYITSDVLENYHHSAEGAFDFESGSTKVEPLGKGQKTYTKREIEVVNKHNEIQKKFLKYLQEQNKGKEVRVECHAHGSSRIDVTMKTSTGFIFYEIKAYNNLRTSIREALGQLLEYCFYPEAHYAEKIVLVSDQKPSSATRTYLNHIKSKLNIPFSYIHFDIENGKVVEEI